MATTTTASPAPEDRTAANKRLKGEPDAQPPPAAPPPRFHPPPPHYPPSAPPPPHIPPGYYGGAPPYASHAPWPGSPPSGRYPPPRGLSPDRAAAWPPHGYREKKGGAVGKGEDYHYPPPPPAYPPPHGYGPPPPHWPPAYASQGTWTGKSPPRSRREYPRHPAEMEHHLYSSSSNMHGPQSMDDDGASSEGESNKEKGRGSYKCGRCGVPKKGHVCPYQPKLKRRPDEPLPQTRNAAVQVEMDEFMTLRRLNIRIQGFPESYATEPYMTAEATSALDAPVVEMVAPPLLPETRDAGVGERSLFDNTAEEEPAAP